MRAHLRKVTAGAAAVAALAIGGGSLASAASNTPPAQPPAAAVDADTLQQGDQATPDTGIAASSEATSAETPGAAEQPGVESSASSDGPGGHADDPANATVDYQFEGVQ